MIDIAMSQFTKEEARSFMNTQCEGVFFHAAPMCYYGDSPLAYACVFGLRKLIRKMLDTELVSLNDNCGEHSGMYPLHAVTINGLRR